MANKILLKDYVEVPFFIETIDLYISIFEPFTKVKSFMKVLKNNKFNKNDTLFLNGEKLVFKSVKLNGQSTKKYILDELGIFINVGEMESFTIEIENEIDPSNNLSLEGLYKSGSIFCTQCEAEGFRKITYFVDRPDNMSIFTTHIEADKSYPILLSNGNFIEEKIINETRKCVSWFDPYKKPAYLFALVAGDLGFVEDYFITKSNRKIKLVIYVDKGNESKTVFALKSLKKAMKWDEDTFNLEYDLDLFMIVAVDAFNFGAMENKGLNIFNSKYVLADTNTATDEDFMGIESVVAHEYFHNWTGNRVTCRDWFQLTLKEGLTVYRDQEFSADMNDRSIQRIKDVRTLRERQFPEDSGPTAHPIRPEEYEEINNFYTATVYEKGAEVIRMIEKIIGKENFKRGLEIYFKNFDGKAVTTENFLWAMKEAKSFNLDLFINWYKFSGTPLVKIIKKNFDLYYTVINKQIENSTPYLIPMLTSIYNSDKKGSEIILLDKMEGKIDLKLPSEKSIPSFFQSFSAPVYFEYDYKIEDLIYLLENEKDGFNQYDAAQKLLSQLILSDYDQNEFIYRNNIYEAIKKCLLSTKVSNNLKSEILLFPSITELSEKLKNVDFVRLEKIRTNSCQEFYNIAKGEIINLYQILHNNSSDKIDSKSISNRSLKNRLLSFISLDNTNFEILINHYLTATNMTDSISAFNIIATNNNKQSQEIIEHFYKKWHTNFLVHCKWFAAQAKATNLDSEFIFNRISELSNNSTFDSKNPNMIRSLFGVLTSNLSIFHDPNLSTYQFIAEKIVAIDSFNPQLAASLLKSFKSFKNLNEVSKTKMRVSLNYLKNQKMSGDTKEILLLIKD